jgi:hypothetical protein
MPPVREVGERSLQQITQYVRELRAEASVMIPNVATASP